MGRHHAADPSAAPPSRRNLLRGLLAVALVALLVAAVVSVVIGKVGRCSSTQNFTVMVDPALADGARDFTAVDPEHADCSTYSVVAVPDGQVAGRLNGGGAADIWLAPSRSRVDSVAAQLDRTLPASAAASSPIVLAGARIAAPASWIDALRAPTMRSLPADSQFATAPVDAAVAEGALPGRDQQAVTAALASYAQATQKVTGEPVPSAATSGGVVAVPEYEYLDARRAGSSGSLAAVVPRTGAPREELQLVTTAAGARADAAQKAADALAAHLKSDSGRQALSRAGLRGADGKPAPEGGVGAVTDLPEPDAQALAKAQQSFSAVAVPIKTLVAMDTSGSMDTPVGNTTRIKMLTDGFKRVVGASSPANSVGLWSFSAGQPDWTELVPNAPLSAQRGAQTQRQALIDAAAALPGRTGGATGLYDTVLAAYDKALADYDPAYWNTVIIETDGRDEKPDSMSLDDLVSRLKARMDPARPVAIHTLAVSQDADRDALRRIADTTGGTANYGETDQQILQVFASAVAKRVK